MIQLKQTRRSAPLLAFLAASALWGCNSAQESAQQEGQTASTTFSPDADTVRTATDPSLVLPAPDTTHRAAKRSQTIGWPADKAPVAPTGFKVERFATDLKHPRRIYIAPNKDVFVAETDDKEKSANQITLLRDSDNDGKPDTREVFLSGLNQPYGILVLGDYFYVAEVDKLVRYPYKAGQTKMDAKAEQLISLPAGGYNHHWTRNIIANPAGTKIYVSVGSASNVGEYGMDKEVRRANILEINPDGTGERVYASGLRNPVGMDWAPGSNVLWTAVNERDEIGDELVPDYMTGVKEGAFYGWPYSYYGQHVDPRRQGERPELVQKAIVPDVPLGAHTASLGLAFYQGSAFPAKYKNGAFIGQHGSWNRSNFAGYKVVFVPFQNGQPSGKPEDFLTGFIADASKNEVYGRPVGIEVMPDGSMLVADDEGGIIWRVTAN
ncbi:sorbosone dehydrogenase family protein [Pontibacter sp. E15-1]|uniref:PQQ-dependent sugar dehydrogenase n=1 Tax=Pontibacter sp. E15-1 TaxID=2919918 RepID=UPI001F4F8821|nr:sorbosone dehydrogenase family protein [Pontibacter sp. E15-1]MCJ8167074.1 sorbosone dehydrogenase family protein [Pontibacter sp. E15-1]